MSKSSGTIVGINGNLLKVEFEDAVLQNEVAYACVDGDRLKSEIIRIRGRQAEMQVFEDTTGLRIGDPALKEYMAHDAHAVFNPSQAWCERTGMPFVFAAWIVRPGVAIEEHVDAFVRARLRGLERLDELAAEASDAWGLPLERCREYLREECSYDAGPTMERTLLAFRDAVAATGACEADLRPRAIPVTTAGASAAGKPL